MYVVYTRGNCQYCVRAKALLSARGLPFETIDVTGEEEKHAMITRIINSGNPQPRTVPQIFEGENYVGGYDQLKLRLGSNA